MARGGGGTSGEGEDGGDEEAAGGDNDGGWILMVLLLLPPLLLRFAAALPVPFPSIHIYPYTSTVHRKSIELRVVQMSNTLNAKLFREDHGCFLPDD